LQYEQERQKFHDKLENRGFTEDELREEYMKRLGDPIAYYCVMGNEILREKFNNCEYFVYEYCLKHNKTWEEVLNFKYDETVDY
jgi:hypothetical protein